MDEVLVAVLRAPRTFTGEDTVEVTCHGGLLPAKLVLDAMLQNGARAAEPGEFTRRAFLNGRIDLVQAEAVADLIHARTELALVAANEQLAGKLSARIGQLRDDLLKTLAHVEAHIDFPDEDIAPDTKTQLLARLGNGVLLMDELLRTSNEGQILRRGVRAAIVGRPNAGKSSLLNQLLGHDRADCFTQFPARRAIPSRKRRIFAAYRLFLWIPPACVKAVTKLKPKACGAAANHSHARNSFFMY